MEQDWFAEAGRVTGFSEWCSGGLIDFSRLDSGLTRPAFSDFCHWENGQRNRAGVLVLTDDLVYILLMNILLLWYLAVSFNNVENLRLLDVNVRFQIRIASGDFAFGFLASVPTSAFVCCRQFTTWTAPNEILWQIILWNSPTLFEIQAIYPVSSQP